MRSPTEPDGGPTGIHRDWLLLTAFGLVVTLIVLVMVAFRAESTTDFRDFWENAVHFRQTGEIANDLGVHNYLPFFTIFMLPWAFLPLPVAAVLFVAISLGLFALTALLVEHLLNDGQLHRPRRALLVALGLMLPYVYACAVLGNLGLLLLFLIVAAWVLVERQQEWHAGVALGLATLIKLLPAVLIVFFLVKKRWRVAGAALATTIVLGLGLPLVTIGPQRTVTEHQEFYRTAIRGHSAQTVLTETQPIKSNYSNNAIPIVLRRLLSPVVAGYTSDDQPLRVNFIDLPRRWILVLYFALMTLILASTLAASAGDPPRWPPDNLDELHALRRQFGLWCCLMLLASPLVWTHYLPLAYWPLAWLADRAERTDRAHGRPDPWCMSALLVWLIAALLLAWPAARAAGAQIAGVLVLWLVLVIPAVRRRVAPA